MKLLIMQDFELIPLSATLKRKPPLSDEHLIISPSLILRGRQRERERERDETRPNESLDYTE